MKAITTAAALGALTMALAAPAAQAEPKLLSTTEMASTSAAGVRWGSSPSHHRRGDRPRLASNLNLTVQNAVAVSTAVAVCVFCTGSGNAVANAAATAVNTNSTVQFNR